MNVMLQGFHLSDQELLMAVDGELSARETTRVESHLSTCWACRTRKQEIEGAIGQFVRLHRGSLDNLIPPSDGPRALLKARLGELAEGEGSSWQRWLRLNVRSAALAAALLLIGGAAMFFRLGPPDPYRVVTVPNPSFTPGATVLRSRQQLCSEAGVKNKTVSAALEKIVLAEYGIRSVKPNTYEVDYLITPALGGADDIHNLWPQSSQATVWNAQVKDALEDHLRSLVCDGHLDLATAQREIAGNWIEAYKKYFRTDRPIPNTQ